MDFVVGLLKTRGQHDSIWIIVDRMTKSVHLLPVKSTYRAEDYLRHYIDEIFIWHVIPLSIISNREAQFTSHLWRSFKKNLGTHVKFSTAFHCQTNRQAGYTIKILEGMLRECMIDFRGSWDDHLPLIEFSYNNSYHSSIGMAPFKALNGRMSLSPVGWFEVGE